MEIKKNIYMTRFLLFFINFINVLLYSMIIYRGTIITCWNLNAREFLQKISYLPLVPWKTPVFSMGLLFVFLLMVILRERFFKNNSLILDLFFAIDILICIAIILLLNMSYRGVIFLAVVNVVLYTETIRKKYLFLLLSLLVYIVCDYDIFSIKFNIISINEYLNYFTSVAKLYLYSLMNVLVSLNQIIFIIFMILTVQMQVEEKKEIKELYATLINTTDELIEANMKLKEYAKKSEDMARTKERNRLAREIHDTIGHSLTGIVTGLEACQTLIEIDKDRAKLQLSKITELARNGLLDVRRSMKALRPDVLEKASMVPAIKRMIEDINNCTSTRVNLYIKGNFFGLYTDEEEAIYRIVQESITNAMRHGDAKNIDVSIFSENNVVDLKIEDDGRGAVEVKEGFGLKHIRERVEGLRGRVEFENRELRGFSVRVKLTLRKKRGQ